MTRSQRLRRKTSRSMMTQNTTASSRRRRRVREPQAREKRSLNQKPRRRAEYSGLSCDLPSCFIATCLVVCKASIGFAYLAMSLFLYHPIESNTLIHNAFQHDGTITRQSSYPPRPQFDLQSRGHLSYSVRIMSSRPRLLLSELELEERGAHISKPNQSLRRFHLWFCN